MSRSERRPRARLELVDRPTAGDFRLRMSEDRTQWYLRAHTKGQRGRFLIELHHYYLGRLNLLANANCARDGDDLWQPGHCGVVPATRSWRPKRAWRCACPTQHGAPITVGDMVRVIFASHGYDGPFQLIYDEAKPVSDTAFLDKIVGQVEQGRYISRAGNEVAYGEVGGMPYLSTNPSPSDAYDFLVDLNKRLDQRSMP